MSKTEVIKHSSTIQVTNTISLLQRRAWNVLLANAYDDLPNQEEFSIRVSELEKELNFNSKNEDYLKETLKALVGYTVEWNIMNKDRETWGVTTVLSQVEIDGDTLFYSYAPALKRRLHNPSMYAKISLSMQNKFNSKYSLALYELFVDYYDASRACGETPWLAIERYRKLMGIEESEYQEFRELKRRTIKSSLDEINEKSDLIVEDLYRGIGRKVAEIKFKIRRKPNALLMPKKQPVDLFNTELVEKLELMTVQTEKAVDLSKRFEVEIIEKWIECINLGYVRNLVSKAGYLITALEDGYELPSSYLDYIKARELKATEAIKTKEQEIQAELIKQTEKASREEKEKIFSELNNDKKQEIVTAAVSLILEEDEDNYNFVRRLYLEKHGKEIKDLTVDDYLAVESILIKPVLEEYRNKVLESLYLEKGI